MKGLNNMKFSELNTSRLLQVRRSDVLSVTELICSGCWFVLSCCHLLPDQNITLHFDLF